MLKTHGYSILTIPLVSTRRSSSDNPSMLDDVRAIRTALRFLIEDGEELLLVLHSAGGFLGSQAMEGLRLDVRAKEGKRGGVKKLVFLSGWIISEGIRYLQDLALFHVEVRDLPFWKKWG